MWLRKTRVQNSANLNSALDPILFQEHSSVSEKRVDSEVRSMRNPNSVNNVLCYNGQHMQSL